MVPEQNHIYALPQTKLVTHSFKKPLVSTTQRVRRPCSLHISTPTFSNLSFTSNLPKLKTNYSEDRRASYSLLSAVTEHWGLTSISSFSEELVSLCQPLSRMPLCLEHFTHTKTPCNLRFLNFLTKETLQQTLYPSTPFQIGHTSKLTSWKFI